jgi:hypothetical protein
MVMFYLRILNYDVLSFCLKGKVFFSAHALQEVAISLRYNIAKLGRSSDSCCKSQGLNMSRASLVNNIKINLRRFCCLSVNFFQVLGNREANSLVAASRLAKFCCTSRNVPKGIFYHRLSL